MLSWPPILPPFSIPVHITATTAACLTKCLPTLQSKVRHWRSHLLDVHILNPSQASSIQLTVCYVYRSGSGRPSRRLTRPSCPCCPPTHASSSTSASHPLLPLSNPPSTWARRAGSLLSHCRSHSCMPPFMHPSTQHLSFPGVSSFPPGSGVFRPAGQHAAPRMRACLSWLPCHACFAARGATACKFTRQPTRHGCTDMLHRHGTPGPLDNTHMAKHDRCQPTRAHSTSLTEGHLSDPSQVASSVSIGLSKGQRSAVC